MIALKIDDIRTFTSQLFVKETFDFFLVKDAQIVTFNTFSIDGRIRQGYYTDEELEENRIEAFSYWKTLRPVCYSLIKGKRLPESFHIVLKLAPGEAEKVVRRAGTAVREEDVEGLYLNIRYENRELVCVTGLSVNYFTLDKTLDVEWDNTVRQFFKSKEIIYMEG
ncbi:DUF5721 family protein [Clostridium sp. AM58-1XD]|uniref:DUF5721 family protein n=1 Tax=Clostridium sp. AM58-1XD TaxID=2292307 RepID=UPI000E4F2B54|nr:DUF5721 family protein [Clostridium sp. AM58-1XD]RGZ00997.1 hypothetical protein DXA13_03170 [Clostridium sp. AM58-1XD]